MNMNKELLFATLYCLIAALRTDAQSVAFADFEVDSLFRHLLLHEVVVKARRPLQKPVAGGSVTIVENTPLSKSGSVAQLLERVPNVMKMKDGYEVVGRGEAVVYLDGRRLKNLAELDNIRSEDIRDIEVITMPMAAHAASAKAVVRISTIRRSHEGVAVDALASYTPVNQQGGTGQADLSWRHCNVDAFVSARYADTPFKEVSRMWQNVSGASSWGQTIGYEAAFHRRELQLSGAFNWQIAPRHTVGARYSFEAFKPMECFTVATAEVTGKEVGQMLVNQLFLRMADKPMHQVNLFYSGTIGNMSINANMDFLYSGSGRTQRSDETGVDDDSRVVTTDNVVRNRFHAARIDMSYPLSGGALRWGGEWSAVRRRDVFGNMEEHFPAAHTRLHEDDLAAYLSYTRSCGLGDITAGVRYEYATFSYGHVESGNDGERRSYGNIFPSLLWNLHRGSWSVQAGYGVTTVRPKYIDLTENITYLNRYCMQTGNPYLRHAIDHELSVMASWRFVSLTMGLQHVSDAIIYNAEEVDGDMMVTMLGRTNAGPLRKLTAMFTLSPVLNRWSPVATAGWSRQWFSFGGMAFDRPVWTASLANSLDLGRGWLVTADMNFRSRGDMENMSMARDMWILGASLCKSFGNDRWTVMLRGDDLLNRRCEDNTIYSLGRTLRQMSRWNSRSATVTLRCRINASPRRYRGAGAGSDNKNRM